MNSSYLQVASTSLPARASIFPGDFAALLGVDVLLHLLGDLVARLLAGRRHAGRDQGLVVGVLADVLLHLLGLRGGCGRGVTEPVVDDVEADGVVLDGRGEVDDGAADDDGTPEQNH